MPKGKPIDRECTVCGASFTGWNVKCKECLSNRTMKMFKYRIYPNKATTEKLEWTLEKCWRLYNAAIDGRRMSRVVPIDPDTGEMIKKMTYVMTTNYNRPYTPIAILDEPVKTSSAELSRELTELKHSVCPEYQEINDHMLREVIERVDLALKAFFKRHAEGVGYPKFKGRRFYNSFASDSGFKFLPSETNPKRAKLILGKIGEINIQLHRPIEGEIKKYIVMREEDQWFVAFSCEIGGTTKLPVSYEDVGIDVGIAQFAALSDGSFIENPRYYRRAEQNLANLQRSLFRKNKRGVKESKGERRRKAIKLVAKAHRKVRNQRKDFLHKESRKLVNRYQIIAFEDLKIKNMSKRPKPKQDEETGEYLPNGAAAKAGLNKSILDASWGGFTDMVDAKAKSAGRIVKRVSPMYTSQKCSQCGHISPDNRKTQAHFECIACGHHDNADTNASINILRKAQD